MIDFVSVKSWCLHTFFSSAVFVLTPWSLCLASSSLDGLQKTLNGLQENMKLYLSSWQSMCQASAAIAEGLVNLATEGDAGKASPLYEIVRETPSTGSLQYC